MIRLRVLSLNYCGIKKNVKEARNLVIDATTDAGSGHPGGSFSMAEIVGTLFGKHLRYDSKNPTWEDRDRLVLPKDTQPLDCSQILPLQDF